MPTPVGNLLAGRPASDSTLTQAGAALAGSPPTPPPLPPTMSDAGQELAGPPPSTGPLDIRPAIRAAGPVINALIPQPVKDVVGGVGGYFGKRISAAGEVIANPILGHADLSPEAIRGLILKYPFFDPHERAMLESMGPHKDLPLFTGEGHPINLPGIGLRLAQLAQALSPLPRPEELPKGLQNVPGLHEALDVVGGGKTPAGEPASTLELLQQRGFKEPFGPTPSQAEAINAQMAGLPIGTVLRALTTPQAASLAIEGGTSVPLLNAIGKYTMLPAGRALANLEAPPGLAKKLQIDLPEKKIGPITTPEINLDFSRTRALPGVKQLLSTFKPGSELPNAVRSGMQDIMRTQEGVADLRAMLREKALGAGASLPQDVQDQIATAIETRTIPSLPPEQQALANKLVDEYASEIQARMSVGLRKHELGAHIPILQSKMSAAQNAADIAATELKAAKQAQSDLPNAIRSSMQANTTQRRLEAAYLKGGRDQTFNRMVAAKTAHAQKIDEVRALQKQVKVLPTAAATAKETRQAFLKAKKKFALAGGLQPRVDFVKRVLTPEKRREIYGTEGRGYGTALTPGGLSTGGLVRRVSPPGETSAQINLRNIQTKGYRSFEPVVKGTMLGGAANDLRVMNAGIVRDAIRRFGHPIQPGETPIGDIYSVKTGFRPRFRKVLEETAVPKEVHEFLNNMNQRLSPEEYGKTANFLRKMNGNFKRWALFSPGFISRNFQNNVLQTMIFGNTDPKNWTDAFKLRVALERSKSLDDLSKIRVDLGNGRVMDGKQYVLSAIKRGVIGRGQIPTEFGADNESRLNPFRISREANTITEDTGRMSFDLSNLRKGMNDMKSADRVDQVLFRYSPRFQSKAFAGIRRNYVPFLNWISQIIPLFFRTAVEKPGTLGLLTEARRRSNEAQGFTDEELAKSLGQDLQTQGGVVVGRALPDQLHPLKPGEFEKAGKVRVLRPGGYGTYDVNPYLSALKKGDLFGLVDQVMQNTYPQISVPYQELRGKDLLTNRDLTGQPITAPDYLKILFMSQAGRDFAKKNGILMDPKTNVVKAPDRLVIALRSVPQLRIAGLLANAFKPDKQSEFRGRSFLYGVTETERNPIQGKYFTYKSVRQQVLEAKATLKRYPKESWPAIAKQYPVEVQRVLALQGYPVVERPNARGN